jgi:hypothetical protein
VAEHRYRTIFLEQSQLLACLRTWNKSHHLRCWCVDKVKKEDRWCVPIIGHKWEASSQQHLLETKLRSSGANTVFEFIHTRRKGEQRDGWPSGEKKKRLTHHN